MRYFRQSLLIQLGLVFMFVFSPENKCLNVCILQEIVVGSNMDKIYIVMDYVEHDLKSLMETMKQPFLVGKYKLSRGMRFPTMCRL